jgi:hypothetical protein
MNKDVKSRIERYTYWDIFEEDVDCRSDREILRDIEGLMTNVVDEVTERARNNGKDVSMVRSNVAENYSACHRSLHMVQSASLPFQIVTIVEGRAPGTRHLESLKDRCFISV